MSEYWSQCEHCGLYKTCSKPKQELFGSHEAKVLIVGEAPNNFDEIKGIPFSSQSGMLLRETSYHGAIS